MSERGPSQADLLLQLAETAGYWFVTSTDGDPFGVPDGESIARPLRGGRGSVRTELARMFARDNGRAPSANALADTMLALEGKAYAGEERRLHLRVARDGGGTVWLDLGDQDGELVKITAAGWTIVRGGGPLFRRTRLTGALPKPGRGGDLAALRQLLRVSDDVWPLIAAWLVSVLLLPGQPVPVLALTGEHGTAKSWQSRVLVQLADPSDSPLRTAPRDVESWAVAASASRVVALDNVSRIEPWLSDCLCRAVTGDGLVRRALYSDSDVSVIAFRRAVLLNGISLSGLRGDLADRLLRVELDRLDDTGRLEESDLTARWEQIHPVALGGLLDLAVAVLAALPGVRLDRLPRMADYARVLAAVDQALGTVGLVHYLGQRHQLAAEQVEDDPVAAAVEALAKQHGTWEGTASALLDRLRPADADGWPKAGRGMSARLTRAAPALRDGGTIVVHLDHTDHRQPRLWRITREETAAQPSAQPEPSADGQMSWSDGADDADGSADGLCGGTQPSGDRPHETAGQDGSDGSDGCAATPLCEACGEPMAIIERGQTTHPMCDPGGGSS